MITTGELLKKERHEKQLALEDIEKKTKIRKKYLTAIEENDWSIFPSKTYIIGVLKTYGKLLKLDEEKLTAIFRREYEKKEDIRFNKRIARSHFIPETKQVFRILVIILIAIFLMYFGYQLKLYFSPPKLEIVSPKKTVFVRETKIDLVGRTEKETIVTVNGERVYLNKNNLFEITIPLTEGVYKVDIEATGANGKKTILRKVFIKRK